MNKKALKQTILIVLGILVAVFIGLLVLGSLLPDEKEPTNEPYKKFNCDSNKINIYAEEYENPNMGTKFESAWVNGHDITKSIEAPDGFSLDEVDVICSKDYFILKTGYMRWPSGNTSSSSFVIFDYNGNKLFAPEAEKNQKLRDKDFTLSPTNDVKESNNVITYTIAYDQREGGELVLFGVTSGERLTCEEYNELKDTLIVSKTYQIEYLGNGKVSDKKLVSQTALANDKNSQTDEVIDYTPDGCNNVGKCELYSNLTSSHEDNEELYELCMKQYKETGNGNLFISKSVNKTEDAKIGFSDGSISNKNGNDIKKFALSYVEAFYNYPIICGYISGATCYKKEVINEVSKQLYGDSSKLENYINDYPNDTLFITTTNYYCITGSGFGSATGIEEVTNNKNGNMWNFKYKVLKDEIVKYANLTLELKDDYWTVKDLVESGN